jgi:iron complex outermembrane recepter protein
MQFRGSAAGGGEMSKLRILKSTLIGGASVLVLTASAAAHDFNIPAGDLGAALHAFTSQAGIALVVSGDAVEGVRTHGAKGDLSSQAALSRILANTGFKAQQDSGVIAIVRNGASEQPDMPSARLTQTTPIKVAEASSGIESVVVTSSKIKGDIQTVPIAITALSQEQLTSRQIAGGPDLVKEVPNLTFSKTNFTGYNIEIRGIGTQAISVTTDPAVAVALNDTAFIRNHFFEQEFYDVSQVEVLRGPQGTLYGRNATAGVVNVVTAKPTDQFEAMVSADIGNYHNRRYEGMVNVPIVDDRLDIRLAGEWTKRDGYSFNTLTNAPIDGRDLWSSRLSIGVKPIENLQATLIWEHFDENDDRIRSAKQLCKTDHGLTEVLGNPTGGEGPSFLSQGCLPTSLYGADAFEVVNGTSLPYYGGIAGAGQALSVGLPIARGIDPYASKTQSRNLRVIESTLNPTYHAKNDVLELNADYALTSALTLSSDTGFNHDFLYSTEDYNRFNTVRGVFVYGGPSSLIQIPDGDYICADNVTISRGGNYCADPQYAQPLGYFCDPQLGCSDRLVAEDQSVEHAWQLNQEFRLATNFSGPLNFSVGANYLYYQTEENYDVFVNTLTMFAAIYPGHVRTWDWIPGVTDNSQCMPGGTLQYSDPHNPGGGLYSCIYIDPNPINSLNNNGHNYFISKNPYVLNSYAGFAEAYYQATPDLKLIGGIRFTDDRKHFTDIPSEVLAQMWGYASVGVIDQEWREWTSRTAVNWTPKLDFTDQTLIYGSYSHGYKAGGANPPGAVLLKFYGNDGEVTNPVHPLTFAPEFIDAFEAGTKNSLADGALTLNATGFYYNYKGYQISEIVDRTSINLNYDATVKGAELETSWEPAPGLKFSFSGGYEDTRVDNGQKAVDLMDRTAGNPDWVVVKPFITQASNCILPATYVATILNPLAFSGDQCGFWLDSRHVAAYPEANGGVGIYKDIGGNQLPNAPHFTTSLTAEYTLPVSQDWAATLHSDFYWQSQSFSRIINDRPYDKIRGYSNVNLALILTSADGWQVLGYLKNIFNTTAITGDFLNSDDTGLTTNVFLTDPRLFGVRVTKNF